MTATAVCPVLAKPGPALAQGIVEPGEHMVAAFIEKRDGPTLIVVAGLHGNEQAGVKAAKQIAVALDGMRDRLRGRVYFVAGNTRALARGVRYIDTDLNRAWTNENLSFVSDIDHCSEGLELEELDTLLDSILVTASHEVYVVDLHSTSAGGPAFGTVGDTLRNRHFAQKFPIRILLGIEEQLSGTMLEYLNNAGAVTLGFEGGSHTSEETVEHHAALIWLALVNAGILAADDIPDLGAHRLRLAAEREASAKIVEVRYRKAVSAADGFVMLPGFKNFDPVVQGQVVARDRSGGIIVREDGLMLMPLYQKLGDDGFFIGRQVSPFWLRLSEILRRLRLQNVMPFLPGVKRDENHAETLIVDTRIARFLPLQIFHLLGFRRRRWTGKKLVVSRRRHDVVSPFARNNGR